MERQIRLVACPLFSKKVLSKKVLSKKVDQQAGVLWNAPLLVMSASDSKRSPPMMPPATSLIRRPYSPQYSRCPCLACMA